MNAATAPMRSAVRVSSNSSGWKSHFDSFHVGNFPWRVRLDREAQTGDLIHAQTWARERGGRDPARPRRGLREALGQRAADDVVRDLQFGQRRPQVLVGQRAEPLVDRAVPVLGQGQLVFAGDALDDREPHARPGEFGRMVEPLEYAEELVVITHIEAGAIILNKINYEAVFLRAANFN